MKFSRQPGQCDHRVAPARVGVVISASIVRQADVTIEMAGTNRYGQVSAFLQILLHEDRYREKGVRNLVIGCPAYEAHALIHAYRSAHERNSF